MGSSSSSAIPPVSHLRGAPASLGELFTTSVASFPVAGGTRAGPSGTPPVEEDQARPAQR